MKITDRENNGVTVLEIKGNIMGEDDGNLFYGRLKELIEKGKKKIVIDLSRVEWINSRGLGILISGLTTMRNSGGELKLAHVGQKINSLLTMTRLMTAFDSYETTDQAVKSFG